LKGLTRRPERFSGKFSIVVENAKTNRINLRALVDVLRDGTKAREKRNKLVISDARGASIYPLHCQRLV